MTHHNPHEAALAFQRGEESGFNFFFNELYPALLWYAKRIIGDIEDAKDAVERSFIKIWETHKTFSHPKVIKSWLYTTVRNDCLNEMLSQGRREARHKKASLNIETIQPPAEEDVIRAEVYGELSNHIKRLPKACAKVFRLILQDKTVREISAELNISKSTVNTQKSIGIELLRKYFSGWHDDKTEELKIINGKPIYIEKRPNYVIVGELFEQGFFSYDIQNITGFPPKTVYKAKATYLESLKH